jgi:hypothetical protein
VADARVKAIIAANEGGATQSAAHLAQSQSAPDATARRTLARSGHSAANGRPL